MLATLGIHELGHKIWASRSGVKTTWPYFIPGPPPLGTFGAVIVQKTPAPNRDALFDVGASGPAMGFIASVMFAAMGFITNFGAAASNLKVVHFPLLFDAVVRLTSSQDSITLNPFIFAWLVGLFVTWINLVPASMLDGGHVANAVLTRRAHQLLTFVSIVVVTLMGYWVFGVFIVLTWMMRPPVPLDNVSELSAKRKLATLCLIAIFLLCAL
jgi:membrane-associated protease RseP (regulator of RpoE activity)